MSRVLLFKYRLIGELELNATGETKRCKDVDRSLQMHSSLIRRLSQERELEVNIWSYTGRKLLHSIDTGHSANIFCSKFVPETSDELVVSGAGDAEVCLFNFLT
ncbi:protein ALTERED SEED GERMINATION 2 [Populus alba]|uniref:protein ALTERED SEED GERMINATION 2 n=1 Tax=Populus alba TaxID=43335 RepID=UPI003CC778F6